MAINKKRTVVNDEAPDVFLASLGFDGNWQEFEAPSKRSRYDERLVQNVERVDGKIDSFEEQLAKIDDENKFAQSLLDNLINDEQNGSATNSKMNQEKVYCNFCDLSFSNGLVLCAHMLDRHVTSSKKLFFCFQCNDSFKTPVELQTHINGHCHDGSCSLCNSCTDAHTIEEVARLKLVCDFCPYTGTSISLLQVHCLLCTNNPENENYQKTDEGRVCHTCLQVFNTNLQMLKHVELKHNGKQSQDEIVMKFVCDECGRRFISGTSLGGHKRVHVKKPGILKVTMKPQDRLKSKKPAIRKNAKFSPQKQAKPERIVIPNEPELSKPMKVFPTLSSGPVEDMPDFL